MKHLIKKYLRYFKVGEEIREVWDTAPDESEKVAEILESQMDGYYALGLTDKNEIVQTFKYVIKKRFTVFLNPIPSLSISIQLEYSIILFVKSELSFFGKQQV